MIDSDNQSALRLRVKKTVETIQHDKIPLQFQKEGIGRLVEWANFIMLHYPIAIHQPIAGSPNAVMKDIAMTAKAYRIGYHLSQQFFPLFGSQFDK
jgi:hypothetical protein